MKNSNKKSINKFLLNGMRNASYTKKEGIYAQLIIQVMKEANKFDRKLDNVYVNHNILESILLTDSLDAYFHDNFGRSKGEFSSKFLKACYELKEQFDSDYPQARKRNEEHESLYYTPVCFGVRAFMRKIISRIVFPLRIKVKVQPIFVSLDIYNKGILSISWYSGKKHGHHFLQYDFEMSRKLNKLELKFLEDQINQVIKAHGYEVNEFEELMDIVDAFISKVVLIDEVA